MEEKFKLTRFLFIVSFALAMIIPFIPVEQFRSKINVDSASRTIDLPNGLLGIEFPVTRQKIEFMQITIDDFCSISSEYNESTPLIQTSLGNTHQNFLQIISNNGELIVKNGVATIFKNQVCLNQYLSEIKVQLNDNSLTIRHNSVIETFDLEDETWFSVFAINENLFNAAKVRASMQTFAYATQPTFLGFLARIGALVFLILGLVMSTPNLGRRTPKIPQSAGYVVVKYGVFLSLTTWALMGTPLYDDGWFNQIFDHPERLNFYNIFNVYDGRFPTGSIWLVCQSIWNSLTENLFWTRLSAAILTFMSWILLVKSIPNFVRFSLTSLIIATGLFLVGAFGFLISNRPEAFIVFLISCVIYLLSHLNTVNFVHNLGISGFIVGLCISTHLAGIVSFSILLVWIIFERETLKSLPSNHFRFQIFAVPFISCFVAFVLNVFLLIDLKDLLKTLSLWESVANTIPNWRVRVWERFLIVFSSNPADTPLRRLFCVSVFLCIPLFGRFSLLSSKMKWILVAFTVSLIFLNAVPSVGVWQLGVFVPFLFLLWVYISSHLVFVSTLGSYSILAVLIAMINTIIWSSTDESFFSGNTPSGLAEKIPVVFREPFTWLLFSFIALLLLVGFARIMNQSKNSTQLAAHALILTSVFLCLLFQLGQSSLNPITFNNSRVSSQGTFWFPGRSDCKLSALAFVPNPSSLEVAQINSEALSLPDNKVNILKYELDTFEIGTIDSIKFIVKGQDYVLIYARSSFGEDFDFSISNVKNPTEIYSTTIPGQSSKNRNGYSPVLIQISNSLTSDNIQKQFLISSSVDGVEIASPFLMTGVHAAKATSSFFQISSELKPYFGCLNESFFSHGLSSKPTILIGNLPSFPTSPAGVFDDYMDSVNFSFDPGRGIMGRLFLQS